MSTTIAPTRAATTTSSEAAGAARATAPDEPPHAALGRIGLGTAALSLGGGILAGGLVHGAFTELQRGGDKRFAALAALLLVVPTAAGIAAPVVARTGHRDLAPAAHELASVGAAMVGGALAAVAVGLSLGTGRSAGSAAGLAGIGAIMGGAAAVIASGVHVNAAMRREGVDPADYYGSKAWLTQFYDERTPAERTEALGTDY